MSKDSKKLDKKIRAVSKIIKITNAMKIIASMKIKKLSSQVKQGKEIFTHLQMILGTLHSILVSEYSKLKNFSPENKTFWIVYTSDLGLCGAYNTHIFKKLQAMIKVKDKLFVVGKKGINHFKFQNQNIIDSSASRTFDMIKIQKLIGEIIKGYQVNWNRVVIIFSKCSKELKIETTTQTLLPISLSDEWKSFPSINEFIVEPDVETVYKNSQQLYLQLNLYNFFYEARLAEEVSRRLSMENANENAKEMVRDLKLKYNQIRQENITREILEISEN